MKENNPTYKVTANEFEFSFTKSQIEAIDLVQQSPVDFNLLQDNQSVNVKLIEADRYAKHLTIEVEGESFYVEIKEELDQMLEKMGFGLIAETKSGAMSLIGVPGEPPPLFRMSIADVYAGTYGVSSICAAPLLGQHNPEIAASVGYAADEIDTLMADGVLFAEKVLT